MILAALRDQGRGRLLQLGGPIVAPVFERELEARHRAEAVHWRRAEDLHAGVVHRGLPVVAQPGRDSLRRRIRGPPLGEVVEHDVHRAPVRGVGPQHHRPPGHRHGMGHARLLERPPLERRHHLRRPLYARPLREHHVGDQVALVLLRNEADRRLREQEPGEHKQAGKGQEDQARQPERASHGPGVAFRQEGKPGVEAAEDPAAGKSQDAIDGVGGRPMRTQENRGQRR